MDSSDLLNVVWEQITNDATFLGFKGLTSSGTVAEKVAYVVKDEETDGVVDNTTIPICLLYIRPGKPDHRSPTVYIGKVVIDCFAKDGNTARLMTKQAKALLQNWTSPGMWVARFAYDTSFKTGIVGVKGHRIFFDVNYYVG